MGYNTDGSADTNYGKSLQDVLSNYTGGVVENVATGGQTSSDALLGNTGYGTFEKYIESNKPDQVILRYGAADAIKLGDASKSLDNIEQMIQIAQRNGSAPVLVGVSPFFGGADSIGGNIAGYLTRESATIADQINEGIKQLAEKYGLQFVDVRSIPIPSGSLLDGVHQDAKFGRQMADLIGNSIRGGSKPTMVAEEPVTKRDTGKVENRAGAYATGMRQGIGGLRG
jgi:lysophospholipase L1-like esterase